MIALSPEYDFNNLSAEQDDELLNLNDTEALLNLYDEYYFGTEALNETIDAGIFKLVDLSSDFNLSGNNGLEGVH